MSYVSPVFFGGKTPVLTPWIFVSAKSPENHLKNEQENITSKLQTSSFFGEKCEFSIGSIDFMFTYILNIKQM